MNVGEVPPFSTQGVKLCVFAAFIEENGGRHAFSKLMTTDVCIKYLKPITSEKGQSYCEYLQDLQVDDSNTEVEALKTGTLETRQAIAPKMPVPSTASSPQPGRKVVSHVSNVEAENLPKVQNSPNVGEATVFISHAWKYTFIEVVDAIQHHAFIVFFPHVNGVIHFLLFFAFFIL